MRFWVGDRLVAAGEASVSVLDRGLTVGDGVFETAAVVAHAEHGAVPFALDRHIARLRGCAEGLGLAPPDPELVRDAMLAVCSVNHEVAVGARLRTTWTGGPGPMGSKRPASPAPTLVVTLSPGSRWPDSTVLAVSPWARNERSPVAGLKTISYAENVVALAHAARLGADEALLLNTAGVLCEGTGSNVFVVRDGVISTPGLDSGCLAGITRALVLEWCALDGIPTRETAIAAADLGECDEVFVTSSTRDVHPVSRILGPQGEPVWTAGEWPVTRAASETFARYAAADWNP